MKKISLTLLYSLSRLAFVVIAGNAVKVSLSNGWYMQAVFASGICTLLLGWVLHDLLTGED